MLLSSHVLSEVELICDRIGLIRDGHLLRVGSMEELRQVRAHRIEALVRQPGTAEDLAHIAGVSGAGVAGQEVSCTVAGDIGPFLTALATWDVIDMHSRELSLEEVFLTEYAR